MTSPRSAARGARRCSSRPHVSSRRCSARRRRSTCSSAAARTPSERFEPGELEPPPRIVVTTSGALGGWIRPGGPFRAAPLPGPIQDAYGCGDCFAAGLTFGLGDGLALDEAVALGARCGAAVLCGRGAYDGQLAGGASGPPTRFDHIS